MNSDWRCCTRNACIFALDDLMKQKNYDLDFKIRRSKHDTGTTFLVPPFLLFTLLRYPKKAGFALLVSWLDSTSELVRALMSFHLFLPAPSVSVVSEFKFCLLHILLPDVYTYCLNTIFYFIPCYFLATVYLASCTSAGHEPGFFCILIVYFITPTPADFKIEEKAVNLPVLSYIDNKNWTRSASHSVLMQPSSTTCNLGLLAMVIEC